MYSSIIIVGECRERLNKRDLNRLKRIKEALGTPTSYEKEYSSYDKTEDFERY